MLQHHGLIHGPRVVIQPPGNRQINLEIRLRHPKRTQIFDHRAQFVQSQVEQLVSAAVRFQCGQDVLIRAVDLDKLQDVIGLFFRDIQLSGEQLPDLVRADLLQLVYRPHDVPGLLLKLQHSIKAVQNLPVIDPYLEFFQTQPGK